MTLLEVVLISFPEAVLVAAIGLLLVGIKPKAAPLALFGVLQAAADFLIRLAPLPFGLNVILEAAAAVGILRVVTRLPVRLLTFAVLLGLIVEMEIEVVWITIFPYFTGYSLAEAIHDRTARLTFFAPEALIMVIIIVLLLRYDFNLLQRDTIMGRPEGDLTYLDKQYFVAFHFVILPVFLLGLDNYAFYVYRSGVFPEQHLDLLLLLMGVSVIVLAPLGIAAVQKIGRAVAAQSELQESVAALRRIEELVQSARRQRHDFNHHLQTVYGLLETGYSAEAREYLEHTFAEMAVTSALIATDNLPMSALLQTKIGVAEARNINLAVTVECSLKDLPLRSQEINSLMGNLIDNALDAVAELPAEEKMVGVQIIRERGRYAFTVQNCSPGESPLSRDMFDPAVTTKAGHEGLGLAIVGEIVAAHGGGIEVGCVDGLTVVTVTIPVRG